MRGAPRTLAALLVAMCLALACPPSAQAVASSGAQADPMRSLGGGSPSCRYALDERARRRCRSSGSAIRDHPLSSYGIDVRAGFSLTDPGETFLGALGSLAAGWWTALVYLVQAVLLLLEWTFALDLTNQAMPDARRSLAQLHRQAFGDHWLMLAISIAGLWGIWRGLVQRRTGETLGGLAATLALMVLALVIINRPGDTVGRAAQLTNDAGMSVLAAATTGELSRPRGALTGALADTFDATVRDPWCALEFGSIDYCEARTGDRARPTNADLWLAYPAQGWERGRLHRRLRGEKDGGFSLVGGAKDLLELTDDRKLPDDVEELVDKAPDRARMQQAGGTFPRLALLALITVGLLGAVALYAFIGVRLLLASGMSVVLLLLAPAMLLAPAVGDSGRATFLSWGKRLLGALLAKLVYGVFLAVVVAASRVFTHLELGWFGTWLLLAAFWWGVFLKRDEITGFVSAGSPRSEGSPGQWLSHGYYAWMLGRGARHAAARALQPARAGADAVQQRRLDARAARGAAVRDLAGERLDARGRDRLLAVQRDARAVTGERARLEQELRAIDRQLRGRDEAVAAAHASGATVPAPSAAEHDLLRHRERLRTLLAHPTAEEAVQVMRHADRNRSLTGESVTRRDLDVHRARRAQELATLPDDHERHLRAVGIDPEAYATADPDARGQMLLRVRRELDVERKLLAVAQSDAPGAAAAGRWFDADEVRARSAEHHHRLRAERRHRRSVDGHRGGPR
ncbi:MAG: hypothetical protein HZB46_13200 [Solirubrobacterales bacterium]|nr:hypothetical protein [Solirubrobacterales bacterium]